MPPVNLTIARRRMPRQAEMPRAIADAIHDSIGALRRSIRVSATEVERFLADEQACPAYNNQVEPNQVEPW